MADTRADTGPSPKAPGPAAAAPPTPPTPPVPLSALLAREDLALRQLAGPAGPDVVVHWAHTSEMADPFPYLLGGELLLTAGVQIPDTPSPDTFFDAYVARVVAAGGAALGFGLAPVHDTVPDALVTACDAHGLPLLEVPPGTTFSGVARAVWQLMAQARLAELRRVTEAQQSLAAAAAQPDPVPSVLRRLAQRLGGHAVLYGPDGTGIATAGRRPAPAVAEALRNLAAVVRPIPPAGPAPAAPTGPAAAGPADPGSTPAPTTPPRPASATDTADGIHLSAYALGSGEGFVLGVAAGRREGGDHTIASVGAVLLSLLTGEHHSGAGAARSSALVRLLLGAAPQEVAPLLGTGAGTGEGDGDGERIVVHARPERQTPDTVAAAALGTALGSPLVDLDGEVVRVLVPAGQEPAPVPGWTLGVSAPAGPGGWPAADTQAARALARARATRVPLVRHGARTGLSGLVPEAEARARARDLLAPLAARPALVDTLRTWLSLHGSWDRTAVALGVHRNTVRQRVARGARLLGADLDDPDVRMELWFALRHC
ncbi:PucR family transcriptional regulator [Streptomyces sp. SID8366]|uniref:PucR family transcriptional regulator n=2 Tax=Streptomyces TaxID=1883 RepID=UPI000DB9FE0A|nr:PucR family transcriptional regulator [Streptomyces sp. PsTaAH-130]MYU03267.1 PucR family transcriptional regulator [Streptomyces sp. SID8366]RAJ57176.1 PucR-like helix-turn-helix protein [Streptomyces sp. PsTaAH-130]